MLHERVFLEIRISCLLKYAKYLEKLIGNQLSKIDRQQSINYSNFNWRYVTKYS